MINKHTDWMFLGKGHLSMKNRASHIGILPLYDRYKKSSPRRGILFPSVNQSDYDGNQMGIYHIH